MNGGVLRGFNNDLRRCNARGPHDSSGSCYADATPSASWLKVQAISMQDLASSFSGVLQYGAQAIGASVVARAAAPSCGACAPQLSCPAIPACVCAGAGGQVPEPSCGGLIAAYAVAALTVGLAAGAAGGSWAARGLRGAAAPAAPPAPPGKVQQAVLSIEDEARKQAAEFRARTAGSSPH